MLAMRWWPLDAAIAGKPAPTGLRVHAEFVASTQICRSRLAGDAMVAVDCRHRWQASSYRFCGDTSNSCVTQICRSRLAGDAMVAVDAAIAGKPAPTGFAGVCEFVARHRSVGAGLLAMASWVARLMPPIAGKPAPTGFAVHANWCVRHDICRSRLAGDADGEPLDAAIAGKPAPTGFAGHVNSWRDTNL